MALGAVTANARDLKWEIGGETSFWRGHNDNTTEFSFAPELEYDFNSKWAVGGEMGYTYTYDSGRKSNVFTLAPHAKYTFASLGRVSFFCLGGFEVGVEKIKNGGDASKVWGVGLTPGLEVELSERVTFEAELGFLGCRGGDDVLGWDRGFGYKLSGSDLSFGVAYHF